MLLKFFPIAFALAIAIGAGAELAFTSSKVYTVSGAINNADTAVVTVSGNVQPLGNNRFILRDSTGQCELQTCPTWFRQIALRANEHIVVTGEIIKHVSPSPGTLYPLSVQTIKRDHGPEIVVRHGMGRPAWLSVRRH
jgi:uncharacterized protein YdeI (BOF family)